MSTTHERVRTFAAEHGIGFGELMEIGQRLWREHLVASGYPAGGEFTVGPCAAMLVPCRCVDAPDPRGEYEANGAFRGCDWCCCTRHVTHHVRAMQAIAAQTSERARQLEESADGMMRASICALADGDVAGAAREQVIAAREYTWASWLYMDSGQHESKTRCLHLAAAVNAGEWKDPHASVEVTTTPETP